jgi:hypothetical protein
MVHAPRKHPVESLLLAAPTQAAIPALSDFRAEGTQHVHVVMDRVVGEVAVQDASEPRTLIGHGVVAPFAHFFANGLELRAPSFDGTSATDAELAVLLPRTDVREAEEIEGYGFPFPSLSTTLGGETSELDQPGLPAVQLQGEFLHAFPEFDEEAIRIAAVLEADDKVIRIPDDDHLS